MSRPLTMRFAALPVFRATTAATTTHRVGLVHGARWLSQTTTRLDDQKPPSIPGTMSLLDSIYGGKNSTSTGSSAGTAAADSGADQRAAGSGIMGSLARNMVFDSFNRGKRTVDTGALAGQPQAVKEDSFEPYHLHVFSHKHNTHVTFTRPNRNAIVSMSCGNVGFKKARRGSFDAAYSLTKYVLERLVYMGYTNKISRVELLLRGFGQGREAASKVIMSPEGKFLRDKIVRVTDSTRVKFAGSRSKGKRRL